MPTPPPITVVPAILAKSEKEFVRKLKQVEGAVPLVQVDVMDGAFVPNKTWFNAKRVERIETKTAFELHLMVNDPRRIMDAWRGVKTLKRVIVHVESPARIGSIIRAAKKAKLELGLAISPGTPPSRVTRHLRSIDLVLVMGGRPGFSGKPLDSNTIDTVRAIRKKSKTIPIGFDIGVSAETIPTLVQAGVTNICAASAIFRAKNPRREIKRLQRIALQANHARKQAP